MPKSSRQPVTSAKLIRAAEAISGKPSRGGPTGANDDADGFKGKLNIYVCEDCLGHIVTRDMDQGVTPFMTSCYATEGCKGHMQSSMYRVFDQRMLHSHEWFRPEITADMKPHTRDHVSKGGLILRERAE
jgi:hypothetical protein